ncbi:MAG: hypothetical protein KAI24_01410 [Planctomycetes bacterium]|nr:hypothetical protein [Planctomycetota bacterium]
MDTNSPTSSAPVGQNSRLARRLALAFGLSLTALTAPAAAQGVLQLEVSDGVQNWATSMDPQESYLLMKATCAPAFAGAWYGPVAFAYQDLPDTDMPEVSTAIAGPFQTATGLSSSCADTVVSDAATLQAFFQASLFQPTQGGPVLSENAVANFIDPLYLPESNDPHGNPIIEQVFGLNLGFPWLRETDVQYVFNCDAVLQSSVWSRMQSQTTMTRSEFFSSTGDGGFYYLMQQGIMLAITLVGMHGPEEPPGVPFGNQPPVLQGFPAGGVPLFEVSPAALIRFGGTGLPWQVGFRFVSAYMPNGNPVNSITIGTPGGGFTHGATGYEPGMQVKLFQNGAPGVTYELDLLWIDYGVVGFRIPAQAQTTNHSVRQYRHYLGTTNGQPNYGPWLTIPQGQRALISVQ